MLRLDVSMRAQRDLTHIWVYIARDNVNAADNVLQQIEDAIDILCRMPEAGHLRDDLTSQSLRFWSVGRYTIVYRRIGRRLRVVRVAAGGLDPRSYL